MMLPTSNCLRNSNSGFILWIYSRSLSGERVFRKAAEVWCQCCLSLQRLTYDCITRSFSTSFNNFHLSRLFFGKGSELHGVTFARSVIFAWIVTFAHCGPEAALGWFPGAWATPEKKKRKRKFGFSSENVF